MAPHGCGPVSYTHLDVYKRQIPGSAERLYRTWNDVVREYFIDAGWSATLGRRVGYRWIIEHIVRDFARLPLRDEPRRPRVGIVGEILVKFHPDANNDVVLSLIHI